MFGHQMDAGGPLPGSLPTGAKTIFGEGIRIPPVKIFREGELNQDVLDVILNNVRMPEMNRADLMGIVAGCRTGEKRVHELCERFGKDTYLAACQALLDRTYSGDGEAHPRRDPGGAAVVRGLDRRRRARPRALQDEAHDLARGRARLLRLVGHRPAGDGAGELLPLGGHVQDVHRGLPDHGLRPPDPLQRRLLSAARTSSSRAGACCIRSSPRRSAAARMRSRASSTSSAARSPARARSTRRRPATARARTCSTRAGTSAATSST